MQNYTKYIKCKIKLLWISERIFSVKIKTNIIVISSNYFKKLLISYNNASKIITVKFITIV